MKGFRIQNAELYQYHTAKKWEHNAEGEMLRG
jgi:hypothetical protein